MLKKILLIHGINKIIIKIIIIIKVILIIVIKNKLINKSYKRSLNLVPVLNLNKRKKNLIVIVITTTVINPLGISPIIASILIQNRFNRKIAPLFILIIINADLKIIIKAIKRYFVNLMKIII